MFANYAKITLLPSNKNDLSFYPFNVLQQSRGCVDMGTGSTVAENSVYWRIALFRSLYAYSQYSF